jgi:hypothetical protein
MIYWLRSNNQTDQGDDGGGFGERGIRGGGIKEEGCEGTRNYTLFKPNLRNTEIHSFARVKEPVHGLARAANTYQLKRIIQDGGRVPICCARSPNKL